MSEQTNVSKAIVSKKGQRYLGSSQNANPVCREEISMQVWFDFKEETSEIRDVRKWIERPWEESNSLAPDMFRESNKPLHVQTV